MSHATSGRRIKMSDVAELAGVSVMTVSNVLNGKPRVSAETRTRVLEVISESGYKVNLSARRLRSGKTGTVALIIPRFDHPYFGELAARMSEELSASGIHLVVEQTNAVPESELAAVKLSQIQSYDGVVLSAVGLTYEEIDNLRTTVPIVLLGEKKIPKKFDHIAMENVLGAQLATEHLIAMGARRIMVLGGAEESQDAGMVGLRSTGWRKAHAEAGLVADPELLVPLTALETEVAYERTRGLVRQRFEFDAVFAVTDSVGLGVLAALHDEGISVPSQVQVVGFDNLEISRHVRPGLTTIDPNPVGIASQACELLLHRMEHGYDLKPPEHSVGTVSLVARGSTK